MKNPSGYLAKLLKREKIYRERYAKSRSNADRLKISVIQRKIREVKALKNDTGLRKHMKHNFTRRCTKKRSTKRVPRKRVVKNLKKKILRLRYQKKRAPKAQRDRINRELHSALVIKNGKKHVKKVGGQLKRYQRIPKGKRTPKVQRLITYYARLYRYVTIIYGQTRVIRKRNTKKVVVRRRVVKKPKKSVIRRYNKKINTLQKKIGKAKPAQRGVIRNEILKIRVIKGGKKYIRRTNRRLNKYKKIYR